MVCMFGCDPNGAGFNSRRSPFVPLIAEITRYQHLDMKFIDKFPAPPRTFTVAPEKEVQPGIVWVDRWFQCQCGVLSPFRMLETDDSPGVPVCSEECAHQMIGDMLEVVGDQISVALSPPSSLVERSLDMGKAKGPIPLVGTIDQPITSSDGRRPDDNLETGTVGPLPDTKPA